MAVIPLGRSPVEKPSKASKCRSIHANRVQNLEMKALWLRIAEGHERQATLLERLRELAGRRTGRWLYTKDPGLGATYRQGPRH
jgi:hypothetical protein